MDPFGKGVDVPCASSVPEFYEVGELSGKQGTVARDMALVR